MELLSRNRTGCAGYGSAGSRIPVLSGQGLRGPILLQEHYEDLVFDRLGQRHPAENLQRNQAGDGNRN